MSFLHSHGIVHRDLKTENVFLDEYLFPKIGDFGLSKITDDNQNATDMKSTAAIKVTFAYIAPEIFENGEYSPAGDVYAFAFIIYEVMTDEKLNISLSLYQIIHKVVHDSYRPELKRPLPPAYQELLESCWSQNPEDRPTFSEIANRLEQDPEFRIDGVDSDLYEEYIEYVSAYDQQFKRENQILHARDFLNQTNGQLFRAITIDHKLEKISEGPPPEISKKMKLQECDSILTSQEMNELNERCRSLVEEASGDPAKEFIIGRNFIEGLNDFPVNRNIGMKFVRRSSSSGSIEASIYLADIYYRGTIIVKDYNKCIETLEPYAKSDNVEVLRLLGKASRKLQHYDDALHYFNEASSNCDNESMYQYGKMLYLGEGIQRDEKRADEYFRIVRQNGYDKQDKFLDKMKKQETRPSPESNSMNNESANVPALPESEAQQLLYSLIDKVKNTKLNYVDIPNGLLRLKFRAFFMCSFLKTITIPASVTSIGNECFYHCETLTQIILPASVTSIGNECFCRCESLAKITIPSSVTSIGNKCFHSCYSLIEITIPSSVTSIGNECFWGCYSLGDFAIPSSVTSIGKRGFACCNALTQITIPSSVTSIGDECFSSCENLADSTLSSSVTSLRDRLFWGCLSLAQIAIPSSVTSIEKECFAKCESLTEVTIPSSVTSIGKISFVECTSLKQIAIPSSVTVIHKYCFFGCSSLEQVIINSSSLKLGKKPFK